MTPDALTVAVAHGYRASQVRPLPPGVANRAYLLGDALVLRILRGPEFEADLAKEAAVIPVARAAGVRTCAVVSSGTSPVPHLLLTRLPGHDLVETPADVYREVGRELATLHRFTATGPPPPAAGVETDGCGGRAATEADGGVSAAAGKVPVDGPAIDPGALVDGLRADGWIDAEAGRWLIGWFARLPAPSRERVLIHGDVAPQNILATDDGTLSGLIDWGDAMWADPAVDFAKISLRHLPAALAGYREAGAPDSDWESRVLWHHLAWALARLRDPVPRPGERHWSAPPAARLLDLMRHASLPAV